MKQANQFTRKEVSRIANEYAGSEGEYSASYFCEHYEATESTFYSVLKKAVVEGIVGMETAKRIAKKSAENSEEHGERAAKYVQKRHISTILCLESTLSLPKWKQSLLRGNMQNLQ